MAWQTRDDAAVLALLAALVPGNIVSTAASGSAADELGCAFGDETSPAGDDLPWMLADIVIDDVATVSAWTNEPGALRALRHKAAGPAPPATEGGYLLQATLANEPQYVVADVRDARRVVIIEEDPMSIPLCHRARFQEAASALATTGARARAIEAYALDASRWLPGRAAQTREVILNACQLALGRFPEAVVEWARGAARRFDLNTGVYEFVQDETDTGAGLAHVLRRAGPPPPCPEQPIPPVYMYEYGSDIVHVGIVGGRAEMSMAASIDAARALGMNTGDHVGYFSRRALAHVYAELQRSRAGPSGSVRVLLRTNRVYECFLAVMGFFSTVWPAEQSASGNDGDPPVRIEQIVRPDDTDESEMWIDWTSVFVRMCRDASRPLRFFSTAVLATLLAPAFYAAVPSDLRTRATPEALLKILDETSSCIAMADTARYFPTPYLATLGDLSKVFVAGGGTARVPLEKLKRGWLQHVEYAVRGPARAAVAELFRRCFTRDGLVRWAGGEGSAGELCSRVVWAMLIAYEPAALVSAEKVPQGHLYSELNTCIQPIHGWRPVVIPPGRARDPLQRFVAVIGVPRDAFDRAQTSAQRLAADVYSDLRVLRAHYTRVYGWHRPHNVSAGALMTDEEFCSDAYGVPAQTAADEGVALVNATRELHVANAEWNAWTLQIESACLGYVHLQQFHSAPVAVYCAAAVRVI